MKNKKISTLISMIDSHIKEIVEYINDLYEKKEYLKVVEALGEISDEFIDIVYERITSINEAFISDISILHLMDVNVTYEIIQEHLNIYNVKYLFNNPSFNLLLLENPNLISWINSKFENHMMYYVELLKINDTGSIKVDTYNIKVILDSIYYIIQHKVKTQDDDFDLINWIIQIHRNLNYVNLKLLKDEVEKNILRIVYVYYMFADSKKMKELCKKMFN